MEIEGSHRGFQLSWLLAILILGCAPQEDEPTVSPPSSPQPATITSEVEFVSLSYLAQRFGEDLWIHQPEVAVQE